MKKLYLLFFPVLLLAFYCCKNDKMNVSVNKTETTDTLKSKGWVFDSLKLERRVHINNDTTKDGMPISLLLMYPTSSPENVDLKNIQKTFAQIFAKEGGPISTPKEAFHEQVEGYVAEALELGKEMEDLGEDSYIRFSNLELSVATHVENISKYLITVSTSNSSYTGGAHGSFYISYANIDIRDGNIIQENQLFKDGYEPKLAKLIQNKITEINNSSDSKDAISLLIELHEVRPNGNFYFTKEGMIYVYNQYEIAPYAQGVVEVLVSYSDIKPLLDEKYVQIIDNI